MSDNQLHCCRILYDQLDLGVILFDIRTNEYHIAINEDQDTRTLQKIDFCPWSGDKLPKSYRDRWFAELEKLGIDPLNDPIPGPYQTAQWRTEEP